MGLGEAQHSFALKNPKGEDNNGRRTVENVTRFAQSAGYKVAVADFEGDFKLTLTK